MKHNKTAGLMHSKILTIIISVSTLLLITLSIMSMLPKDTNYEQSLLACSQFFSQVNGKTTFFDENLDGPTNRFNDAVENFCPSGEYKISEDNIFKGAKLIDDCWKKTARGENIMGANVEISNVMLYCGDLVMTEDIDNFGEELRNKIDEKKYNLFNESETVNLNEMMLDKELLKTSLGDMKEKERISVFYSIYINKSSPTAVEAVWSVFKNAHPAVLAYNYFFDKKEWNTLMESKRTIATGASQLLAKMGIWGEKVSYAMSQNPYDSYSGIVVVKDLDKQINEDGTVKGFTNLKNMNVVIPTEHYKLN